jgi:hypothetical protein
MPGAEGDVQSLCRLMGGTAIPSKWLVCRQSQWDDEANGLILSRSES